MEQDVRATFELGENDARPQYEYLSIEWSLQVSAGSSFSYLFALYERYTKKSNRNFQFGT